MALPKAEVQTLARRIAVADEAREVLRPLTITHPGITLEDGYAVQSAWADIKLAQGASIVGHKIGLTSKAMQSQSVVDEPDYGVILDDTVYENGSAIPPGVFHSPRVEIELAFVLKSDLRGPRCTLFDVLRATEYICPAIEILNSRLEKIDSVTGQKRTIVDSICANAGYGGLVLGGRPFLPTEDINQARIGGACLRNGEIEETGLAAGVLGHPANAIAWLANKMAAHGATLKAGEILLSGSFIRPVPARPGDTFQADFGRYGSVNCHFSLN
ncbi:2-oxo-hept-4-ene-1,7-dioate hydratase [Achromobacter aloeverae]